MKTKLLFIITFFIFAFNYAQYSIDDTQTVPFTDISTTGTEIVLTDDGEANITAPWTLYLGSQGSTDLRIGNNGAILFGVSTGDVNASNIPLTTSTPMIAPFWDDFDTELGGVYYQTIDHTFNGVTLYSEFIIQWDRVHYNGNSNTDIASFQVVFKNGVNVQNEVNKKIIFIYKDVDLDGTSWDYGASATIGVASADGVSQYSYNTPSLTNVNTLIFSIPTTYIPDDNFEAYLETHNANGDTVALGAADSMGNGVMNDDYVLTSRIENVTYLNVGNQSIADLTGIEDFVALTDLRCFFNNLTTLDISANTGLTILFCYSNNLSTLDLSANTALTNLSCGYNNLATLDLSTNVALTGLNCSYNNLTTLDLSANTALTELFCYNNDLSILNLDANNHLEKLWTNDNPNLTTLSIQNGANNLLAGTFTTGSTTYARFRADNNPNLTCVFVDNATDANNGVNDYEGWQVDATATFVETEAACDALQTTYVPDDNFEAYLETHNANGDTVALGAADSMGNGVMNDDYVLTSRIENVTSLNVGNQSIANLIGIEDFVALTYLDCYNNDLSTLDLNANMALTHLNCAYNNLTNLDVSANTALTYLNCYNNDLTTLVSTNPTLIYLYCPYNNLTNLDVSSNTALGVLHCYGNNLSSLDVSANTALNNLDCRSNNLSTLDVRNIPVNQIDTNHFNASNNPNLTCIYTDDVAAAETNWTNIDATATFVQDEAACDALQTTYVPDDNFEAYLETHNANGDIVALGAADSMGNGVMNDDYVLTSRIENVTILDIYNQNISDLTGIEDFVALTGLECGHNDLSTLDVSTNMALTTLYCGSNNLSSLDVSTNTALTTLYCGNNNLSSLDVSANTALTALHCGANNLSTLDLSANTALTNLDCDTNNLSSLDLSTNTALTALYCYENNLSTLNLDTNNQLERLWINDNPNLTILSIQNGANNLLAGTFTIGSTTYANFRADNNPNLTCIFVDNATDANNGVNDYEGWQVDATATFVETEAACNGLGYEDLVSLGFELYPNPVKDVLYLRANKTINQIRIYNMLGQEVINYVPLVNNFTLDVSNLKAGAYFIKVQVANQTGIFKFIKQ